MPYKSTIITAHYLSLFVSVSEFSYLSYLFLISLILSPSYLHFLSYLLSRVNQSLSSQLNAFYLKLLISVIVSSQLNTFYLKLLITVLSISFQLNTFTRALAGARQIIWLVLIMYQTARPIAQFGSELVLSTQICNIITKASRATKKKSKGEK